MTYQIIQSFDPSKLAEEINDGEFEPHGDLVVLTVGSQILYAQAVIGSLKKQAKSEAKVDQSNLEVKTGQLNPEVKTAKK